MVDLAQLTEARRAAFHRAPRRAITLPERERIIDLLTKLPLPEVRRLTGREYGTLVRIAQSENL